MSINLTAESAALLTIGQIAADIKAGTIPTTVRTFAELHDYVDANEYLINVLEAAEVEHDAADFAQADLLNEAMDKVDAWLNRRGRAAKPGRHS